MDRRHVSILLSLSARRDAARAIFQLAHETIHLLAPKGSRNAPVLEEGLATCFSHQMCREWGSTYHSADPAYLGAARIVQDFLDLYPDGVRTLREREPCFTKMTVDVIGKACPNVPPTLAVELCAPFSRVSSAAAL
jgi:hypothetical protein